MTLPWSEDWIWQSALGSKCSRSLCVFFPLTRSDCTGQQMFTLTVDVMRAGMTRYPKTAPGYVYDAARPAHRVPHLPSAPGPAMMLYVMGHWPGNTPASFRRQFFVR